MNSIDPKDLQDLLNEDGDSTRVIATVLAKMIAGPVNELASALATTLVARSVAKVGRPDLDTMLLDSSDFVSRFASGPLLELVQHKLTRCQDKIAASFKEE